MISIQKNKHVISKQFTITPSMISMLAYIISMLISIAIFTLYIPDMYLFVSYKVWQSAREKQEIIYGVPMRSRKKVFFLVARPLMPYPPPTGA